MPSPLAALVVSLVAASSATAQTNSLPAALDARRALVPRQTASHASPAIPTECWNAVTSLYSSLPTLPPDVKSVVEAELERDPMADLCSIATPSSLAAQFSSYSAQVDAWSRRNANQLTACSDLPDINAFAACGSGRSPSQPTNAAVTSSTANTKSANAPARQTGMAAAAVVAVGLAVAIL
ncbi:hypothetical protein G6O67_006138 [Ophiocordyceps sinensis]|uniref:Infection structure specific protein n=1 Tax=Ophiocordyceps sinensis TaxID=72228 RepID=A0A8H4LV26_9HYPO|nr:hypothetical protein G6O67_006138 [Ophiocordyceps sinensis]